MGVGAGCVATSGQGVTVVGGGVVFTATRAMIDNESFDFNAFKETAPPETEWFALPFPFETVYMGLIWLI